MEFDFYKKGREPDFVGENAKWWKQETHDNPEKCAILEGAGYSWWYVEMRDEKNHVILKWQNIVHETKLLDSVGIFLDLMCFSEGENDE